MKDFLYYYFFVISPKKEFQVRSAFNFYSNKLVFVKQLVINSRVCSALTDEVIVNAGESV